MLPYKFRFIILTILLFGIGVTMNGAEPDIKISTIRGSGIALLDHTVTEFQEAWPEGVAPELKMLLPYTVVIKNNTDREVIAYLITWEYVDQQGTTQVTRRNVYDFSNLNPGSFLSPGAIRPVLNPVVEIGKWSLELSQYVDQLAATYSQFKEIRISLDAVLFLDGEAIGPNRHLGIEKWSAMLTAEQEAFQIVDKATGVSDKLLELEKQAQSIFHDMQGRDAKDGNDFGIVLAFAKDHPESFLSLARGFYARTIREDIAKKGELDVIAELRRKLGAKTYPNVRRMERKLEDQP